MRNTKTKKKRLLTWVMALSIPIVASAQGGLFQRGKEPEGIRSSEEALLTNQGFGNHINGNNLTNNAFGNQVGGSDLTNQTFGAPIGSGLFVMLIAGAGYSVLKKTRKTIK